MLIRKEVTQFFRNKFLPTLLIFMPIMLVLVMPLVSQMDIQSIKVAIIDHDRSTLSMRMESHIANTDYFRMQSGFRDYDDAIHSMPTWVQCITYTFPTRYVINIFRDVYLKGTLLSELRFDILMLVVLAVFFNVLATITYKKQQ
jgi:ABC-2 type transport system permease protein